MFLKADRERKGEIERDFYFLKVHLGDSTRQPQPSRENLEWYPMTNPFKSKSLVGNGRERKRQLKAVKETETEKIHRQKRDRDRKETETEKEIKTKKKNKTEKFIAIKCMTENLYFR